MTLDTSKGILLYKSNQSIFTMSWIGSGIGYKSVFEIVTTKESIKQNTISNWIKSEFDWMIYLYILHAIHAWCCQQVGKINERQPPTTGICPGLRIASHPSYAATIIHATMDRDQLWRSALDQIPTLLRLKYAIPSHQRLSR